MKGDGQLIVPGSQFPVRRKSHGLKTVASGDSTVRLTTKNAKETSEG